MPTAATRVHRLRIVERPLDEEVSCEISRQAWRISSREPTTAGLIGYLWGVGGTCFMIKAADAL